MFQDSSSESEEEIQEEKPRSPSPEKKAPIKPK